MAPARSEERLDQPRGGHHLVAQLRQSLAADPRTSELGLEIHVAADRVVITGSVATEERRRAVSEVARISCPGRVVENQVRVVELAPADTAAPTSGLRLAATADVHFGLDSAGRLKPHLERLRETADLLLIAGDLTLSGRPEEAAVLAAELTDVGLPVVAVLGNHDHHRGEAARIAGLMSAAGVRVLEGDAVVLDVRGHRLGVAGVKGFGGGFAGACGTEFGEAEMKAFIGHSRERAAALAHGLASLAGSCESKVVLTHYAPVRGTLVGEPLELYPFLGSYLLGEVVDGGGVEIAFHGHAHSGTERATTPGGVPVLNVAQPVIGRPFNLYRVPDGLGEPAGDGFASSGLPPL